MVHPVFYFMKKEGEQWTVCISILFLYESSEYVYLFYKAILYTIFIDSCIACYKSKQHIYGKHFPSCVNTVIM